VAKPIFGVAQTARFYAPPKGDREGGLA